MGKFTNLLLLVAAIQLAFLFTGYADIPFSELTQLILHPDQWSMSALFQLIFNNIISIGVFATFMTTALIFRTDTMMFAGLYGIFLGWIIPPLITFYNALKDSTGQEIAIIVCAPILILYIFTTISAWRGRDA